MRPLAVADPFDDGAGTALKQLVVDHDWVGVISDYVGLGTAGPHAYLVGEAAARNVLDATRAARQLSQPRLDRRTVVWGHSQGGHGAVWAGGIGPRYAPELDILGVAALAPATDLDQLATGVENTTFGRIVSAYLADSWAAYYELVRAPLLVAQGDADPLVLPAMQRQWAAARCAAGQQLDFRSYPGLDHLSLVAAESPLTPALVAWAPARLAGNPARTTC